MHIKESHYIREITQLDKPSLSLGMEKECHKSGKSWTLRKEGRSWNGAKTQALRFFQCICLLSLLDHENVKLQHMCIISGIQWLKSRTKLDGWTGVNLGLLQWSSPRSTNPKSPWKFNQLDVQINCTKFAAH